MVLPRMLDQLSACHVERILDSLIGVCRTLLFHDQLVTRYVQHDYHVNRVRMPMRVRNSNLAAQQTRMHGFDPSQPVANSRRKDLGPGDVLENDLKGNLHGIAPRLLAGRFELFELLVSIAAIRQAAFTVPTLRQTHLEKNCPRESRMGH
ncbi:MAG: hypothetical protein WDZ63_16535 [Burkholderiales bacterium]